MSSELKVMSSYESLDVFVPKIKFSLFVQLCKQYGIPFEWIGYSGWKYHYYRIETTSNISIKLLRGLAGVRIYNPIDKTLSLPISISKEKREVLEDRIAI